MLNENSWGQCSEQCPVDCRVSVDDPDFADRLCMFPFKYEGTEYNACTSKDDESKRFWCAAEVNKMTREMPTNKSWGECNIYCPIHYPENCEVDADDLEFSGWSCQFPFAYGEKVFNECINFGNDISFWCPVLNANGTNTTWAICNEYCPKEIFKIDNFQTWFTPFIVIVSVISLIILTVLSLILSGKNFKGRKNSEETTSFKLTSFKLTSIKLFALDRSRTNSDLADLPKLDLETITMGNLIGTVLEYMSEYREFNLKNIPLLF